MPRNYCPLSRGDWGSTWSVMKGIRRTSLKCVFSSSSLTVQVTSSMSRLFHIATFTLGGREEEGVRYIPGMLIQLISGLTLSRSA